MPENIFKVYRPSNSRSKKGPGSWHNESEKDRFSHIKMELSRYCDNTNDYDDLDLVWHIKNAVNGDVYFSEAVYQGILSGQYWNKYYNTKTIQGDIIQGIITRNTKQPNGEFDEKYMEIRKYMGNNYSNGLLVFEHIIPAKVFIQELINAYEAGKFDIDYFRSFRKKIAVCIVTKQEDEKLNRNKLRESMPDGWDWDTGDPFARYKYSEIGIHS